MATLGGVSLKVKVAEATALLLRPGAKPMALTVAFPESRKGPAYTGDDAVGTLPSSV